MKKIFFMLIGLCTLALFTLVLKDLFIPIKKGTELLPISNSTVPSNIKSYWIKVADPSKIKLQPNFREKLDSSEVISKYKCDYLVSAGFYSKEDRPLGLFISNGIQQNKNINSNLFNGYFSIDSNNIPKIGNTPSKEGVRIAIQSGPILISDGKALKLNLYNDEEARRMVVILTKEKNIIFSVFYNPNSVYMGPKLADLPQIVKNIENEVKEEFDFALNLDGGSASTFISPEVRLEELVHSGSFFCITR